MALRFLEACNHGRLDTIINMRNVIDFNIRNYWGDTGLMNASYYGYSNVVNYLVKNGASVNVANCYGSTALHWAASGNHVDIIKILVHNGANIHTIDKHFSTAKMVATIHGYDNVIQFLTHCEIVDATLALSPLKLSPYVLLWILQWAYQIKDRDQLRVLRLVESIKH